MVVEKEDVECRLGMVHAPNCEAPMLAGELYKRRSWPAWLKLRDEIRSKRCCPAPAQYDGSTVCEFAGVVGVEVSFEHGEEVRVWDCPACQGQHVVCG